jgi:hypothetical protein
LSAKYSRQLARYRYDPSERVASRLYWQSGRMLLYDLRSTFRKRRKMKVSKLLTIGFPWTAKEVFDSRRKYVKRYAGI